MTCTTCEGDGTIAIFHTIDGVLAWQEADCPLCEGLGSIDTTDVDRHTLLSPLSQEAL
jgi:DnaJ-class molecular chaperone